MLLNVGMYYLYIYIFSYLYLSKIHISVFFMTSFAHNFHVKSCKYLKNLTDS